MTNHSGRSLCCRGMRHLLLWLVMIDLCATLLQLRVEQKECRPASILVKAERFVKPILPSLFCVEVFLNSRCPLAVHVAHPQVCPNLSTSVQAARQPWKSWTSSLTKSQSTRGIRCKQVVSIFCTVKPYSTNLWPIMKW